MILNPTEILQSLQLSAFGFAALAVSAAISLLGPVALCVYLGVKRKAPVSAMLTGAAVFVLFALVLEQLVLSALFNAAPHLTTSVPMYVIIGTLAAGIFEETGRFTAFHILRRGYASKGRELNLNSALGYGAGHGGVEAILLSGLAMLNSIVVFALINAGQVNTILPSSLSEELRYDTALRLIDAIQTPPLDFLAGGVERISAVILHMCLSVLVWMAVAGGGRGVSGTFWYYPLAILLHAGVNVTAALYQKGVITEVWLTEGIVALSVAVVLLLTIALYRRFIAYRPVPIDQVIMSFTPHDGEDDSPDQDGEDR